MMRARLAHNASKIVSLFVVVSLLIGAGPFVGRASAGQLQNRTVRLSNNTPDAENVSYGFSFGLFTMSTIGSIELKFCGNSALFDDPCDPPWGFDASNVTIANETGVTGLLVHANSGGNDVILTRPPTVVGAVPVSFDLGNIINPADPGSFYVRMFTYPTTDATGPPTDIGAAALAVTNDVTVSAEVPPYLIFCSAATIPSLDCSNTDGNYVNLGDLGADRTSSGETQLLAATNADFGYTIRSLGPTMTSGNNILPPMETTPSQTGVSQFGINLRKNTTPAVGRDPDGGGSADAAAGYNQANRFRYADGDIIAAANSVQDYRRFTVSYVVNVNKNQPPGVYVTTITYLCLANF